MEIIRKRKNISPRTMSIYIHANERACPLGGGGWAKAPGDQSQITRAHTWPHARLSKCHVRGATLTDSPRDGEAV